MSPLRTRAALEKNRCVGAEFVDDLTACTARRAGHALVVNDGDCADLDFGTEFRDGSKNRGALGAVRHTIRSVFHITTAEVLSVRKQDGRTDPKL